MYINWMNIQVPQEVLELEKAEAELAKQQAALAKAEEELGKTEAELEKTEEELGKANAALDKKRRAIDSLTKMVEERIGMAAILQDYFSLMEEHKRCKALLKQLGLLTEEEIHAVRAACKPV